MKKKISRRMRKWSKEEQEKGSWEGGKKIRKTIKIKKKNKQGKGREKLISKRKRVLKKKEL